MHLAALHPEQRLVLLTPFDRLLAVARGAMLWLPGDLLLIDSWDAPLTDQPPDVDAAALGPSWLTAARKHSLPQLP